MPKAEPVADQSLLTEIQSFAEDFSESRLRPYIKVLHTPQGFPRSSKEINDAIWGTIRVHPLEVAILDSPLLQRLRSVRQLGVIHWVYPGAVHTRFEHSLGVLHQAQQLIAAINDATPKGYNRPIDENLSGLVRLCALLHDIGHSVFSHVSEHSLIRRDDVRLMLAEFATEHGLGKTQLSEVVAYFIIGSSAFREMLSVLLDKLGNPIQLVSGAAENAKVICEHVQRAIIGRSISDQVPLLHEIVTGPFDADKLDYFVRDAKLTGVPSVLDISRLLQKVSVRVVPSSDLPERIGSSVAGGHTNYYIFGLKWSGAAVLDELHLARVLLYAKIYRHQKVLATEAMVDALIDTIGAENGIRTRRLIEMCYRYADDELLWSDASQVLSTAGIDSPPSHLLSFVRDTLGRLRDRRLFISALAARASYPGDPWLDSKLQSKGLSRFVEAIRSPPKARKVRDKIVGEIASIISLVPEALCDTIPPDVVPYSVVVSAKSRLSGGTEIDRAFVFQGTKIVPYRDLSGVNRPAWADAYDLAAASGHIFCPRELASTCYIAAEKILRTEYDVILPDAALEMSKQSASEVKDLKIRLETLGYYDGVDFDIRPVPARLGRADIARFLDEMTHKFESVDEPQPETDERRPTHLRDRIFYWLNQFRNDDDVSCAMECLRQTRVLSREDTKQALLGLASADAEFLGSTIVLLGGLKDSAAIQAYLSKDLDSLYPRVMTVEEAARQNIAANVVFVDDFIGSGGQTKHIFGSWFDDDELRNEKLNEQRELFGETERAYLRSRKIGFAFAAGWSAGEQAIKELSERLKLQSTVHIGIRENEIPFAFQGALGAMDTKQISAFRKSCELIGEEILQSNGMDAAKIANRTLGYGNRGMLLLSRYNVPTQTLTCMWSGGSTKGVTWTPLLRRRAKR